MKKILSIIIPTYNSESTLSRALESVLFKDNFISENVEIIVCDDFSNDNSVSTIRKLSKGGLIKLVKNTSNLGPGVSRNKCIEISEGRWISFLDSDDYYKKKGLKNLISLILKHEKNGVDLIIYGYKGLSENLKEDYLKLQTDGSVIYSCVNKNIITDNNIVFSEGYHEDVDYQFKLINYSKKIKIVNNNIYKKSNRQNSIVNTITEKHIDGFFRAWEEIFQLVKGNNQYENLMRIGTIGLVSTRIRAILQNEPKVTRQINLLKYLKTKLKNQNFYIKTPMLDNISLTKYEKMYAFFMKNKNFNEAFIQETRKLEKKSWSCSDLQNSIFFGPDEIRTCCKRFFYRGEMKGDVVLLKTKKKNLDALAIRKSKQNLIEDINKGNETPCTGCPYLEFKDWHENSKKGYDYISMEYHSICNLKCSYCSDKYYGGLNVQYDIEKLINDLIKTNTFDDNATFIWGGGEPTIVKNFNKLINVIIKALPNSKQKVLSNSVKFSRHIKNLLNSGRIDLVTSIDAGSEETFLKIRGKNRIYQVLENLYRYSKKCPEKVVIKYIFTEGNLELNEIIKFVAKIRKMNLTKNVFQISTDFNDETINVKQLQLIVSMYGFLIEIGVRIIFLDDLIINRLRQINKKDKVSIEKFLEENNINNPIAKPEDYESVNIWGAGWNTKFLLERTDFFKQVKVENIIDDTPEKINTLFAGHKIKSSKDINFRSTNLVVSAVQGYPRIYLKALEMGVSDQIIINKILL